MKPEDSGVLQPAYNGAYYVAQPLRPPRNASGICCKVFCGVILTLILLLGIVLLAACLIIRPRDPKVYLTAGAADIANASTNPQVKVSLLFSFRNPSNKLDYVYDWFSGNVYYRDESIASMYWQEGFQHPHKNTTSVSPSWTSNFNQFSTATRAALSTAAASSSSSSKHGGRLDDVNVDVRSDVRAKLIGLSSKRGNLRIRCMNVSLPLIPSLSTADRRAAIGKDCDINVAF